VSAVDGGLFIIARLLFTQQLGNTHDIFRSPCSPTEAPKPFAGARHPYNKRRNGPAY
jgi:hypothetical protein